MFLFLPFLRLCVGACLALLLLGLLHAPTVQAAQLTLAFASDLAPLKDPLLARFRALHPQDNIEIVLGASGQLFAQIQQGAPFDVFFSADTHYPQTLYEQGQAAAPPRPYARGELVFWQVKDSPLNFTAADLMRLDKLAIANPRLAPYGQKAQEALSALGLWSHFSPTRLVMGQNLAQTAQLAATGHVRAAILARSQMGLAPLRERGHWTPIPPALYSPLIQSLVITRAGQAKPLATAFVDFWLSPAVQQQLRTLGLTPYSTDAP